MSLTIEIPRYQPLADEQPTRPTYDRKFFDWDNIPEDQLSELERAAAQSERDANKAKEVVDAFKARINSGKRPHGPFVVKKQTQ